MPESSFADCVATLAPVRVSSVHWSRGTKMVLLMLNALPFFYVTGIAIGAMLVPGVLAKAATILAGIYLLPPVFVRLLLTLRPVPAGSYAFDAPEFLWWWASAQGQVLFCRFPFLEEILRLVPGAYSGWLRVWGAKIGRFTYWAPGLRILDRSLLEIGDDVVFGAGVRLNPHVIAEDESGATRLHLGPVRVGSGSRIGGYSLLSAGTVVEPGQTLKAFSLSPPFTTWRAGRRAKIAVPQ